MKVAVAPAMAAGLGLAALGLAAGLGAAGTVRSAHCPAARAAMAALRSPWLIPVVSYPRLRRMAQPWCLASWPGTYRPPLVAAPHPHPHGRGALPRRGIPGMAGRAERAGRR